LTGNRWRDKKPLPPAGSVYLKLRHAEQFVEEMKILPISINSLQKIVERNMLYIDKTEHVWELVQEP